MILAAALSVVHKLECHSVSECFRVCIVSGADNSEIALPFQERIIRNVECQVLAIDLRGHGETVTADEHNLSMDRLVW